MRNIKFIVYAIAIWYVMLCGFNNSAAASTKDTVGIGVQMDDNHMSKIQFLNDLYSTYVFGGEDFSPIARNFCTDKMRKILSDAYGYDCYDGECYAVWLFRSGVQDGPDNVCRVTNISQQKDGWFLVNFIDMGNGGCVRIKFTDSNGSFKMDDIENQNFM